MLFQLPLGLQLVKLQEQQPFSQPLFLPLLIHAELS
jgi:hypothetical protein